MIQTEYSNDVTVKEFDDLVKAYQSKLLDLLLRTTNETVIDRETSLKLFKQLSKTLNAQETWK
jgi:hypothetical protein